MSRSRFVTSASASLLLVTAIFVVTAACDEIIEPCKVESHLDGVWRVTTINGQPAQNWPLPGTQGDTFQSGNIEFFTTFNSSCNGRVVEGAAVAFYIIRKGGGLTFDRFSGKFNYNRPEVVNPVETIRLTAVGYEVRGTVNGNTMTLPAAHKSFGNATVVLVKESP